MGVKRLLEMYMLVNVSGFLFMLILLPVIDSAVECMKKAIRIKHLFLIPLLLLFLPWVLFSTLINLSITYDWFGDLGLFFDKLLKIFGKLLNKELTTFEKVVK